MNSDDLRALQAPLKAQYKEKPESAVITLTARGVLGDENVTCKVETGNALAERGFIRRPEATGSLACSGDMLLEALVGVRRRHVERGRTAIGIALRSGASRRRRSRFSRHARRRQGRPGGLSRNPSALRARHRRHRGAARNLAQAHRALLRGPADDPIVTEDRSIAGLVPALHAHPLHSRRSRLRKNARRMRGVQLHALVAEEHVLIALFDLDVDLARHFDRACGAARRNGRLEAIGIDLRRRGGRPLVGVHAGVIELDALLLDANVEHTQPLRRPGLARNRPGLGPREALPRLRACSGCESRSTPLCSIRSAAARPGERAEEPARSAS